MTTNANPQDENQPLEKPAEAPRKNITRKVVERYSRGLELMVKLECGHTKPERSRWVNGEIVLNKTARCWDCETLRDSAVDK